MFYYFVTFNNDPLSPHCLRSHWISSDHLSFIKIIKVKKAKVAVVLRRNKSVGLAAGHFPGFQDLSISTSFFRYKHETVYILYIIMISCKCWPGSLPLGFLQHHWPIGPWFGIRVPKHQVLHFETPVWNLRWSQKKTSNKHVFGSITQCWNNQTSKVQGLKIVLYLITH